MMIDDDLNLSNIRYSTSTASGSTNTSSTSSMSPSNKLVDDNKSDDVLEVPITEEENESFGNLFKMYDDQNNGFITVERFINITKQMSDSWKDDDDVSLNYFIFLEIFWKFYVV
jgi:Ca2+-binding EF-hand superfamily protein